MADVDGYPGLTGNQLDHLVEEGRRLLARGELRGVPERWFTVPLGGDETLLVTVRPRGILVEYSRSPLKSVGAHMRRLRQVLAATYLDPTWWWWQQVVRLLECLPERGPVIDTTGD